MDAENSCVDDGSESEVIKNLGAVAPDINRSVFSETFVVETVNLSDLS